MLLRKQKVTISLSPADFCNSAKYDAVSAYLLALNAAVPDMARSTIYYKSAIEEKCNTQLTVDQFKSKGFTDVIQILIGSQAIDELALNPGQHATEDALGFIRQNIDCHDFGVPFFRLMANEAFQKKYERLYNFLYAYQEMSATQPH
ncbi:hypothetical protein [Serratia fonticola]